MEKDYDNIRKWILSLISQFRKEFGKEKKLIEGKFNFAENFSEPCQIAILWMRRNDKHDYQILLKVHNLARNDKEVTIYGPYSLDNKNDVKNLEKLLEKDFFKIVDQDEELEKYSELVENFISEGYNLVKRSIENKKLMSRHIKQRDYLTLFSGRCDEIAIKEVLERVRKEISLEIPRFEPLEYKDFFGGFIRPPVWFGEIPEVEYSKKLKGSRLAEYIGKPHHFMFKSKKIMLKQDGYIAISLKNWGIEPFDSKEYPFSEIGMEDIVNAKHNLNEFYGMLILRGFSIHAVDTENYSWKTYVSGSDFVTEAYKPNSYGEKMYNKRFEKLKLDDFKKNRQIISINIVEEIIEIINFIQEKDKDQETKLFSLIETLTHSHTNLIKGINIEALNLSWVIIEQIINFLCDKNQIKPNKDNVKSKIVALKSSKVIDELLFKKMDTIRYLRNKALHEMRKIKSEEAKEAFLLSRNLINFRIKNIL